MLQQNKQLPAPKWWMLAAKGLDIMVAQLTGRRFAYQRHSIHAVAGVTAADKSTVSKGKRLQAEWRWVLGEAAVDIRVANLTGSGSFDIVVLGEHMLVLLDEYGQMRMHKRLDYFPAACTCYPVGLVLRSFCYLVK